MRRSMVLVLLILAAASAHLPAADRIGIARISADPDTADAKAAATAVMDRVAPLAGRLYPQAIAVGAPGARDSYTLSVFTGKSGDTPMISLRLEKLPDGSRSASYTYFGAATPEVPTILARAIYLLWANLAGKVDTGIGEGPVVAEDIPADFLGTNLFPMGAAVLPQGNVVLALGMACVEVDPSLAVVRRIGTTLVESGLYALAYGVSATPAGTVMVKPGTGRDAYRLAPGAVEPQRVALGLETSTLALAALPDGSIFAWDTVKKLALRIQGRQRQELKVFSSSYSYIGAAAAGPDGTIWVYDQLMKGIRVFTTEGTAADCVLPLVDLESSWSPSAMAVGPDGGFVVLSYGQLARFRRDGSVAWRLTSLPGADDTTLPMSGSLAVDWARGVIYLGDITGRRIVKLVDTAWCRERGIGAQPEQALAALRAGRASDEAGSLAKAAAFYEAAGARGAARWYWARVQDADPGNTEAEAHVRALEVEDLRAAARELDARARSTLAAIGLETARPVSVLAIQKYEQLLARAPEDDASRAAMNDLADLFSGRAAPARRRPLAIGEVKVAALFPSLMQSYAAHPPGTVAVKNALAEKADAVRVSFFIPRFMDFPSDSAPVASLAPGEVASVPLLPAFSTAVLQLQEDIVVQAQLTVTWGQGTPEQTATKTVPVTIYRNAALTWNDTRKIASFITPNDEPVSGFAARTIAGASVPKVPLAPALFQAMRVCDALGTYGIAYVQDPDSPISRALGKAETVDTVRFPRTTLFNRTGDCDDTTALLCSLLESAGIRTAVLTTPGHIFMAFDSGEPAQNAPFLAGAGLEVIARDGECWIPVETTLLSKGFMAAWGSASELVRRYASSGPFEMLPVRSMRDLYPALPLPATTLALVDPAAKAVDAAWGASFAGFTSTLYTNRLRELTASIAGMSARQAVKVRIQVGILHAMFGKTADAEAAFRAAIKEDPSLVSPYVNLANLRLLAGDADGALAVLAQGLAQNAGSAMLNILAARAAADKGDASATAAYYARAQKASPELAGQYPELASVAAGASTARASKAGAGAPMIWDAE